jgi:hypothetical protein
MIKMMVSCLVVVGLFGSATSEPRAGQQYPTNIDLLAQAVRTAVAKMDVTPPAGGSSDLSIEAGTGSDAGWLVEEILKGKLISLGWTVKMRAAEPDSLAAASAAETGESGFALRVRIVSLDLIYGRSWRRYLVVGKRVERIARVSVFYDLVDRTKGDVILSSSFEGELRDVVPASALGALSDSKYAFASPQLEKSQWDRYVEGGLVLAIVGVLVYLFYSNKTAA